jgi:hypothetical protein
MKRAVLAIGQTNVSLVQRRFFRVLARSRLVWLVLLASLLLSGCVQYDVGVNFDNPHKGEIVQHIKLGERLTSFSGDSAQEWLDSIERRTQQLQGKTKRLSNQEISVTIPFNNGAELEEKFNEFFNPTGKKNSESVTTTATELPSIDSKLSLTQNNLLLLLRNRLSYDLDLRSLELISTNGNLLISPGDILKLEFSLNTPWGARSVETDSNTIHPESYQKGRQLVWTLKPGQLNHVEAEFLLPSPIGIGSFVIILFVAAGMYLRYNFMPDPTTIQPTRPAVQ